MVILHFLTGKVPKSQKNKLELKSSKGSTIFVALYTLFDLFLGGYNATANTTPTPFHHPAAQIREYLEAEETWWPCSPEFINYSLALLVYSVRYPAVFWNTNKGFAFLFSLQLLANSLQNLLALGGISIMYKVQMLGPHSVLHKYEPFLLNTPICMLLYR